MDIRTRISEKIRRTKQNAVIKDRRFLDDEQLIRSEQLELLEEIFNANVRDREINEISSHLAPIMRNDHPYHLALWGKTGTGKTLTMSYFLRLLAEMCRKEKIPLRYQQLDLSTARPCFRALNDLACLLNASKRYKKGISLEELMLRIEASLENYRGYLILFVDEVDNVRRDKDTFLAFLIRRLPQRSSTKLILVFASNHLNWTENLDPRVRSFLKLNELIFEPYDALDLQKILRIRVEKALWPDSLEPGVIEKIAALSSRDHGDARKAVALLGQSAALAEKQGTKLTLAIVDQAAVEIEQDRYMLMIRTAPPHLQAALAAAIDAVRQNRGSAAATGQVYDAYLSFCGKAHLRPLAVRAFTDLLAELDLYSFLRTRVHSRGRFGRSREVLLELPEEMVGRLVETIRLNFELGGRQATLL